MNGERKAPSRILLVSYPKILFLYPTLVVSLVAAVYMSFAPQPTGADNTGAIVLSVLFLGVLAMNLVVLAFDFPRTTSLTLFFLSVAAVLGFVLLCVLKPEVLPFVAGTLRRFSPSANATFYWAFGLILGLLMLGAIVIARFDCWEARPNELLHRKGIWGDLDRFPAPGLRVDKEITDIFEYFLLQSGRLILHITGEPRAVVLENVPFIKKKEAVLTRMLGTLQVAFQPEGGGPIK